VSHRSFRKRFSSSRPVIHFENRQCGLRAQKILLAHGGIIASDRTRAPFGPVSPMTRRSLIELAAARDLLIMRWAANHARAGSRSRQPYDLRLAPPANCLPGSGSASRIHPGRGPRADERTFPVLPSGIINHHGSKYVLSGIFI
jgi:hypothetical protein